MIKFARRKTTQEEVLEFEGRRVVLQRISRYRGLRLRIDSNQRVEVRCSQGQPLGEIWDFLKERRSWMDRALLRFEQEARRFPAKRFVEGEDFLFFGHPVSLHLVPGLPRPVQHRPGRLLVDGVDQDPARIRRRLRDFYREVGCQYLTLRLAHWVQETRLQPARVVFRSQKSRWGSCSSRGTISLNWMLIAAPAEVIDYVIVHELCHLKQMNHSTAFWKLVGNFVPDVGASRSWLRENSRVMSWLMEST